MSLFDDIFPKEGRNAATASLFEAKNASVEKTDPTSKRPLQSTSPPVKSSTPVKEKLDTVHERTVFVGNLSLEIKQLPKKLKRHFASCGDIESVRLRSVPAVNGDHAPKRILMHNKRFRQDGVCNAYIVFRQAQGAQAALELNMTQFRGRALRIDMAGERRFRERRTKTTIDPGSFSPVDSICVKHLDATVSDEELLEIFNGGALVPLCQDMVRNWRIVRDHKTGESKGYAFIAFKRPAAAKAARALNGYTLGSQSLRIESLTPQRRERPRGHGVVKRGVIQTKGRFKRRC